ncbi:DUF3180 domain-containing protein [Microbacterium sp. YY-01]|uniref:DUF3180 domain-containing protein n=1 Tax=Microbacterium sp. YY-01 TaxID=3421634 RepID=UPI003D162556
MKRTSVIALVVAGVVGLAAGFLVDQLLTASGRATFSPSGGLPILLLLLAAALLALAWPVRRSVRSPGQRRVDPFRALRTAMLARASSLVGAGLVGFAGGLIAFLYTRPIDPPLSMLMPAVGVAGSAAVLIVAALIAEAFCILPPDDGSSEGRGSGDDGLPSSAAHDGGQV